MLETSIIITKDNAVPLMKELQIHGSMEIKNYKTVVAEKFPETLASMFRGKSAPAMNNNIKEYHIKVERIMEAFESVVPPDRGMLSIILNPEIPEFVEVERGDIQALFSDIDERMKIVKPQLDPLVEEKTKLEEHIEKINRDISELKKIDWLEIPLEYMNTKYVRSVIALSYDPNTVEKKLRNLKETEYYVHSYDEEDTQVCFLIFSTPSDWKNVDAMLRNRDIERINISNDIYSPSEFMDENSGRPADIIKNLKEKKKAFISRKKEILSEMKELYDRHYRAFLVFQDSLSVEYNLYSELKTLGESVSTVLITGYAPVYNREQVYKIAKKFKGISIFNEVSHTDEKVPVELHNPSWAKPYETLTRMFSTPKYDEIDPTIIIAPLFVIFFGLMLGDAFYGILITIAGFILLKTAGKADQDFKNFGIIFTTIGLSTVFFGIIQGGYLGNGITFLFGNGDASGVFGNHPSINNMLDKLVIINGLKDPMRLLQIALIVGLFQINLGLVIAAYQEFHRKNYSSIIMDQVTWFILEPGVAILMSKFFGWYYIPSFLLYIGVILTLIGIVMVFKNKGALGFFDITGFLGNWLSYARLLALGLATAGIAMTVNILASLIGSVSIEIGTTAGVVLLLIGAVPLFLIIMKRGGYLNIKIPHESMIKKLSIFIVFSGALASVNHLTFIFIIVGVVVFLGGHIFNSIMQSLGAFVHSLRLQYVEFFGTFFTGGGNGYKPFKEERKYTKLSGGK